jgi:hypothetical protein
VTDKLEENAPEPPLGADVISTAVKGPGLQIWAFCDHPGAIDE